MLVTMGDIGMAVMMAMVMRVVMAVIMGMTLSRSGMLVMMVFALDMNVELSASDTPLGSATEVEVITIDLEFSQLVFEPGGIHAQIQQSADKHVAADSAEEVEVKGLHERSAG